MMKKAILAICMICLFCFVSQAENMKEAETGKNTSTIKSAIEVHGHWTIEVLDKDGKSVSITEFDNHLYSTLALINMLGPGNSLYGSYGNWQVYLQGNPQPCDSFGCIIASNSTSCSVDPSLSPHSTNLTESVNEPVNDTIILSGSVVMDKNTSLESVQTGIKICRDSVLPSNCVAEDTNCMFVILTEKMLAPSIAIQAGQQVLVTVEISFS